MAVDPAWVLALMLKAEPSHASSPWRSTYESTAAAIARGSDAHPVFSGPEAAERTAALLVAIAWFESRFRPDAEGDRPKRADGTRGDANSFCLLQVGRSNFDFLKTTREALLTDIDACVNAGLRMLAVSFSVCRTEPFESWVAHYAGGGATCAASEDARTKSRHRMLKARWLFRAVPLPAKPAEPRLPG